MVKTEHLISGLFMVLPCIENYSKIDMRSLTYDVPPQEVSPFHIMHGISGCLGYTEANRVPTHQAKAK